MKRSLLAVVLCLVASLGLGGAHEDLLTQIADLDRRIATGADADLLLRRADLRRRHQEWEAALRDYQSAEARGAGSGDVAIGRAAVHLDRGAPQEALRAVAPALEQAPEHGVALLLRARALARLERVPDASAAFSIAIRHLEPVRPEHFLEHAKLLSEADPPDPATAVRVLEEGMVRLGDLISLQARALELERQSGSLDAALARARRVSRGPGAGNPSWHLAEAEILRELGQTDEAQTAFAAALQQVRVLIPRRRNTPAMREVERRAKAGLHGISK